MREIYRQINKYFLRIQCSQRIFHIYILAYSVCLRMATYDINGDKYAYTYAYVYVKIHCGYCSLSQKLLLEKLS